MFLFLFLFRPFLATRVGVARGIPTRRILVLVPSYRNKEQASKDHHSLGIAMAALDRNKKSLGFRRLSLRNSSEPVTSDRRAALRGRAFRYGRSSIVFHDANVRVLKDSNIGIMENY
eukprot:COSAG01_NODE_18218_length_1092_cov_0.828802_2_plen_116_part_01